jgi:hypothetical protein
VAPAILVVAILHLASNSIMDRLADRAPRTPFVLDRETHASPRKSGHTAQTGE